MRYTSYLELIAKAHTAGLQAAEAAIPQPMLVGHPSTPFGTDVDPQQQTYIVPDGPCGFAWINVKPANSSFARHLIDEGIARRDHWEGGVRIWVSDFGQSHTRKAAYAAAYAMVLRDAGFRAYSASRLD